MKPKRPSKKAKIEEPCKYQWWKDEELKNSALKIYVDTEEQPKENHPLLKIPPITDDFEVPIENCKRLFRKNPAYHEVLTSMYSLDDSDRKFCEIENINKFQLKRFFTHGSRSVHDFFFRPNQLFMVGIDCETFSKLFKRYENVLESFAEKNSFKSLELIPHHDQIPHMSEEVIPETQMSDEETPEYMCFAPPKQKTPVRNKDKLFRSSYAAALKMSHEAHLFHAHAVDLVASATEDLNFAQKVSEQHKLRFDDDVICLGTLDPPDDGCVNDKDVDDIECKLSAINALADVLADIDADSDSDLDLNSDNEFMEAPKASDDLVKLIKEQAATINAFAIPGLSAIRSAKLSPECQAKVEAK
uniref:Uncharacterized protein n=1 Tax=Panagrolaimus sp. PS1159 TaxID=55785 RepID=A0AC35GA52_9BILA